MSFSSTFRSGYKSKIGGRSLNHFLAILSRRFFSPSEMWTRGSIGSKGLGGIDTVRFSIEITPLFYLERAFECEGLWVPRVFDPCAKVDLPCFSTSGADFSLERELSITPLLETDSPSDDKSLNVKNSH